MMFSLSSNCVMLCGWMFLIVNAMVVFWLMGMLGLMMCSLLIVFSLFSVCLMSVCLWVVIFFMLSLVR